MHLFASMLRALFVVSTDRLAFVGKGMMQTSNLWESAYAASFVGLNRRSLAPQVTEVRDRRLISGWGTQCEKSMLIALVFVFSDLLSEPKEHYQF